VLITFVLVWKKFEEKLQHIKLNKTLVKRFQSVLIKDLPHHNSIMGKTKKRATKTILKNVKGVKIEKLPEPTDIPDKFRCEFGCPKVFSQHEDLIAHFM
jgi:hypothetical protein